MRDRLLNRKRKTGENYEALLTRHALERFLYRLSTSSFRNQFVLKGAYAFLVWEGDLHRPTRDIDFLGFGQPEQLEEAIREIASTEVPEDGVEFDPESVEARPIRDEDEYGGTRIKLDAGIGSAELRLQIDVGFGDAVTPAPEDISFPSLLDFPTPKVRSYPKAPVVAEKLHGLVVLGIANSRMKDFYDLWYLSQNFTFQGELLTEAIQATFDRRETSLPDSSPLSLSEAFAQDNQKQQQWSAFVQRTRLEEDVPDLQHVIDELGQFLLPPLEAASREKPLSAQWLPPGPWRSESA
ncbi:nucleotidyl transferase AbiEii/AbiGii toxin family protein [Salinibacter sp. 10B]|uniref:nucleotidyl transferase AbiEii/AbiGii toxin family protein n=1 Tax=Salinibacter sp. 10B TaxID=1923971 RepID=UPI001C6133C3|nr:nucleotidyl transferase AbiEii/AbiGii toxin family protein [Salinibacter sp. 10B]